MLAWWPSWISAHCIALKHFILIKYFIPKSLGLDTKMNLLEFILLYCFDVFDFFECLILENRYVDTTINLVDDLFEKLCAIIDFSSTHGGHLGFCFL